MTNGIQFFGEIDCNETDGSIRSDMPAWYFDAQIEELRESADKKQRFIDRGLVEQDQIPVLKNEIRGERARLRAIEGSRPKLSGKALDMSWSAYQNLGKQIAESMPTRKETRDGLVNPQEELGRLKDKRHITINTEIAKACGVNAVKGRLTGDQANKCYQILGKALGENTSVEKLRRDGNSEAYKTMDNFTQAIIEGLRSGKGVE